MTEKPESKEKESNGEEGGSKIFKGIFGEDSVVSLDAMWTGWKLARLVFGGEDIALLKTSGLAKFDEHDDLIELSAKSMSAENYRNYNKEADDEIKQKITNLAYRIEAKMSSKEGDDEDGGPQSFKLYKKMEGDIF